MEQLDPSIVALAKAIGTSESSGNYNAQGKSGEYGAYQYTKPTWEADSQKYLGQVVPLEQATPAQQDEVAYKKIQDLGKQGYNPAQIASIWNSGKPDWEGNVGVNKYGVKYDTPAYVRSVQKNYEAILSGQGAQPDSSNPSNVPSPSGTPDANGYITHVPVASNQDQTQLGTDGTQPRSDSLGGQLAGRVNDVSQAVSDSMSGKQGYTSGLIQSVGALAGGIGDVVNKGLELIPGVKAIENWIGGQASDYAKTPGGQAVVKSLQDFGTAHPELSKDIGAGFNIVTAIPILRGLGAVKNVVMDGASQALKGIAEKVATDELTAAATATKAGRTALAVSPDAIKTIVTERALPDIVDNRYVTKDAFETLGSQISHIEDTQLQPLLAKLSTTQVADRESLEALKQEALDAIRQEFKGRGDSLSAQSQVKKMFKSYQADYGDYVTLQDVNDMKRLARKGLNFNSPQLESDVSYQLGQVFMKNIETQATRLGLGDVHAINAEMGKLIQAQNVLKHIEGRAVKTGLIGSTLKNAATIGGEMAGNSTGIPLAGAFVARQGGGYVGKKIVGATRSVLNRTGKNAVRAPLGESAQKIAKGARAGLIQKALNKK